MARHDYTQQLRRTVARIPIIGPVARKAWNSLGRVVTPLRDSNFSSSGDYWEQRYAAAGTSGTGSYGKLSEFKAEWLNEFVRSHNVTGVVELGCGDGNQLSLMDYPRYVGLDISASVIERCRERFGDDESKSFCVYDPPDFEGASVRADVAVSLDVVFHLVEDETFERYIRDLFSCAEKYVVIYSDDSDQNSAWQGAHIRHRRFTPWVEANEPGWELVQRVPNKYPYQGDYRTGSYSDFFVYARRRTALH